MRMKFLVYQIVTFLENLLTYLLEFDAATPPVAFSVQSPLPELVNERTRGPVEAGSAKLLGVWSLEILVVVWES